MRGRTSSDGASLFLPLFWQRWEIDGERCEQGVIKQPNEFVALLRTVFKWSPGFVVQNLLFQRCQRSFWQSSYHSMSNCSSSRNNLDFFFLFTECCETKALPPLVLICLGRVPLGGGSTWTERTLPEDYRMRGGEMRERERACVRGVYVCVWWAWGGGGVASNFTQNAAIVPKIEQCRVVTLIFQSIHYLLCIYLSLSHK